MAYLLACLMASLSFLINKRLWKSKGPKVILTYGPAVEEGAKTILAWYLGADIFATHVGFGIIEGAYDYFTNSGTGVKAALLSISGHSLFGLITLGLLALAESVWLALAGAIIAHVAWNSIMVRLNAA